VKFAGKTPSAQAENSWNLCNSRAKPHLRKLKIREIRAIRGHPPSAQAKAFVQIRAIRGRKKISASWYIRENSRAKPHLCKL